MKTVLLAPTPPPAGGIAGWTARMMNAKLKNNWKLVVVDEKTIGKRHVFGKEGKRNVLDEIKRCLRIWSGLRKELRDSEVKVVHSCIPSVTLAMIREYICAIITRLYNRKFIIHFRCTVPNTTQGKVGHFVLKRLCNKSDLIISLNEQSSNYLRKITKTSIKLIPNFISNDELSNEHKINDDLSTILYVGGLVKNKGIYDCLRIAKHFPNITFRFVGEGNSEFENMARTHNIFNVVFTGPKDHVEVKQELENADVFLFMTYFRGEGFSNALCEAMAEGLPCIATDWAANKDMIGDDGGVIVAVGDIKGAFKAVKHMKSKDVRKKMSDRNIRRVKEKYAEDIVLQQYIDAYESLL